MLRYRKHTIVDKIVDPFFRMAVITGETEFMPIHALLDLGRQGAKLEIGRIGFPCLTLLEEAQQRLNVIEDVLAQDKLDDLQYTLLRYTLLIE